MESVVKYLPKSNLYQGQSDWGSSEKYRQDCNLITNQCLFKVSPVKFTCVFKRYQVMNIHILILALN